MPINQSATFQINVTGQQQLSQATINLKNFVTVVNQAKQAGSRTPGASGGSQGFNSQNLFQFAYFLDDIQYGMRGIANNIPGILAGLGLGAGLAGTLSIAAAAGVLFANSLEDTGEAAKKAQKDIDNVNKEIENFIQWRDRVNERTQSESQGRQGKAIDFAFGQMGGSNQFIDAMIANMVEDFRRRFPDQELTAAGIQQFNEQTKRIVDGAMRGDQKNLNELFANRGKIFENLQDIFIKKAAELEHEAGLKIEQEWQNNLRRLQQGAQQHNAAMQKFADEQKRIAQQVVENHARMFQMSNRMIGNAAGQGLGVNAPGTQFQMQDIIQQAQLEAELKSRLPLEALIGTTDPRTGRMIRTRGQARNARGFFGRDMDVDEFIQGRVGRMIGQGGQFGEADPFRIAGEMVGRTRLGTNKGLEVHSEKLDENSKTMERLIKAIDTAEINIRRRGR